MVPLPEELASALRSLSTLTLAYTDAEGPQACAVLYAVADPSAASLVFVSDPVATRHGRALAAGGSEGAAVAFTAQADGQEWSRLTGLQGRGRCRRAVGAEREAAFAAYADRFPFVREDARLRAALAATALWELRPTWLRSVDNGRGFGHKTEWTRPTAPPSAGCSG
ncbi:pyridoxamine 5'-phosphate oxidase [Streptomyces sp. NPDC020807]|uniref:pyridoxamine 5'-phosphate oxidase n=1 Tax=Streptomyces sp. NPDC020807 TaxID=3155119 RepID=UPI0033C760CA